MRINLNQYVSVVLNERGVEILKEYYRDIALFKCLGPGEAYQVEIWGLMAIFGQHMYTESPFESTEVDLSFENFKELDPDNKD